jgi:hypothetical protein
LIHTLARASRNATTTEHGTAAAAASSGKLVGLKSG